MSYDASAIMTPANAVSVARIVLSPVLFVLILMNGPSYPALFAGIVIAVSDGLDGFLARRHGATRSGAFLDPLADKVLVLGALACMVAVQEFPRVPALLIGARELAISVYRSFWAKRGVAVPARRSAKVKTVIQELAIAFALVPPIARHARWFPLALLWLAVVLTLWSGAQYVLDGQRARTRFGVRENRENGVDR